MELDLLGVDLRPVPRLGARQAQQLLQPADRRRHRHHVDLGRVAGHQLGGQGHHVAHAAVDVDPALDVVLADLADPPGHQVGDGREVVHPHGDRGVLRADAPASGQHHRQRRGQALQSLFEGGGSGDRRHGPFLRRPEFTKPRGPPPRAEPYVREGVSVRSRKVKTRPIGTAAAALRRGRALDQPARAQREPVGRLEHRLGVDLGQPDHVVARLGDLQPHPVEHLVVGAQQQHLVGQVPEGGEAAVEVADVAGEVGHQDAVADRLERRLQLGLDHVGAAPGLDLGAAVEQRQDVEGGARRRLDPADPARHRHGDAAGAGDERVGDDARAGAARRPRARSTRPRAWPRARACRGRPGRPAPRRAAGRPGRWRRRCAAPRARPGRPPRASTRSGAARCGGPRRRR